MSPIESLEKVFIGDEAEDGYRFIDHVIDFIVRFLSILYPHISSETDSRESATDPFETLFKVVVQEERHKFCYFLILVDKALTSLPELSAYVVRIV